MAEPNGANFAPRVVAICVLLGTTLVVAAACNGAGKEKLQGAASSLASAASGRPTASQLPVIPSESPPTEPPTEEPTTEPPSEAVSPTPTETEKPTPSRSPKPTESPSPSPSPTESPEASPSPSPSSLTPAPTATAAPSSGGDLLWLWILLGALVVGGIVFLIVRARSAGQAAAQWRSRAREPYSRGVVLH
ncbi:MAG TPA: hypothetical protein VGH10_03060, partial [Actinomycetota bacterium]